MIPGRRNVQGWQEREIMIPADEVLLEGTLALPRNPTGIVLFAHGSGSSRFSPRNRQVAGMLQAQGIATLLFDLLTREEGAFDERTGELRFDIPLLARRLNAVTRFVPQDRDAGHLPIGYFGASTGAAAALIAAAELPEFVSAVVSRGGRPDLAFEALEHVQAPTLLIVGEEDKTVLRWNRQALAQLGCEEKQLDIVPGATHLFEEPGALEEAAGLAADWFSRFLLPAYKIRPAIHAAVPLPRRMT